MKRATTISGSKPKWNVYNRAGKHYVTIPHWKTRATFTDYALAQHMAGRLNARHNTSAYCVAAECHGRKIDARV